RDSQLVLCSVEDRVPESRLAMRLELRQVEVRPGARRAQSLVVPKEIEPEVEERAADRLAVDLDVALDEVPAARTDEQGRNLVVQHVDLLARVETDRPLDRIREVALSLDHVLPRRRVRVLEVGHEDARARG